MKWNLHLCIFHLSQLTPLFVLILKTYKLISRKKHPTFRLSWGQSFWKNVFDTRQMMNCGDADNKNIWNISAWHVQVCCSFMTCSQKRWLNWPSQSSTWSVLSHWIAQFFGLLTKKRSTWKKEKETSLNIPSAFCPWIYSTAISFEVSDNIVPFLLGSTSCPLRMTVHQDIKTDRSKHCGTSPNVSNIDHPFSFLDCTNHSSCRDLRTPNTRE